MMRRLPNRMIAGAQISVADWFQRTIFVVSTVYCVGGAGSINGPGGPSGAVGASGVSILYIILKSIPKEYAFLWGIMF